MAQADIEEFLKHTYPYELVPDLDDGGYFAHHPDLEGCFSQGDTAEEAIVNLDDARLLWFQARLLEKLPIPRPLDQEPSGRFSVRVPRATHGDAVRAASRQGVSLNQLINTALAEYLGATTAVAHIRENVEALGDAFGSKVMGKIEQLVTAASAPVQGASPARWEEFAAVHDAGYRLIVHSTEREDHRLAKDLLETLPEPRMSIFFRGLAFLRGDPMRGYELCLRAWRLGLTFDQASLVLAAIPEPFQLDDLMKERLFKPLLSEQSLVVTRQTASMLEWVSRQRRLPDAAEYYAGVARDPEGAAA